MSIFLAPRVPASQRQASQFQPACRQLTVQADLPFKQRQRWVNRQATAECKRELEVIWEMFKKDPLSPFTAYCSRYVVTGMGMFTEGYTICKYLRITRDHVPPFHFHCAQLRAGILSRCASFAPAVK